MHRLVALTVAILAPWPASASAVDRVVQNDDDSGGGSLRATIASAGAGDTVVIPSTIGTIKVESKIQVDKALTIDGASPDATQISGEDAVRVFEVAVTGTSAVTLRDLTVRDGRLTNAVDQSGACILHSLATGSLTLDNVVVRDCVLSGDTLGGAAISSAGAPLTLIGSDIVDNTTTSSRVGAGGAIVNQGGTISVDNGEIARNTLTVTNDDVGDSGGGGISSSGGTISIAASSLRDNAVVVDPGGDGVVGGDSGGGAVFTAGGDIAIADTVLEGNSVTATDFESGGIGGGAIYNNEGNTQIARSEVMGNTVSLDGAPGKEVLGSGGGGIWSRYELMSLLDSTVAGNSVTVAPGRIRVTGGGGVFLNSAPYAIDGSTLSGNTVTASDPEGGGFNGGGAMMADEAYPESFAVNSTFSGNSIAITGVDDEHVGGGAVFHYDLNGEGLWRNVTVTGNSSNRYGGAFWQTPLLQNTIVAGNTAAGLTNNCAYRPFVFSHLTSAGHNLSDDATCNLTAVGDKPSTNPLLKPLGSYGGPTLTHDLNPASPARNAAATTDCPTRDQRGLARPFGGRCDIGAVEGGATEEAKVDIPKGVSTQTTTAPPTNPTEPPKLIVCGGRGTIVPQCFNQLPPPRPLIVCGPSFGTILRSCEGLGLKLGIARGRPWGLEEDIPIGLGCGRPPRTARAAQFLRGIGKQCTVIVKAVMPSIAPLVNLMVPQLGKLVEPLNGILGNFGALTDGRSALQAGLERAQGGLVASNADFDGLLDLVKRAVRDEDTIGRAIGQTIATNPARIPSVAKVQHRRLSGLFARLGGVFDKTADLLKAAPQLKPVADEAKKARDSGWSLLGNLDKLAKTGDTSENGGRDRRAARAAQAGRSTLVRRIAQQLPLARQSVVLENGTKRTVKLKLEPWARKALRRYRGRTVKLTFVAEVVREGTAKRFTRTVRVRIAGKPRR